MHVLSTGAVGCGTVRVMLLGYQTVRRGVGFFLVRFGAFYVCCIILRCGAAFEAKPYSAVRFGKTASSRRTTRANRAVKTL